MREKAKRAMRTAGLVLLIASTGTTGMAGAAPLAEIEVSAAAALILEQKVFVLDVREPSEYKSGHIAGSVLIPVGQVNARFEELLQYKDQPMLVVCGSGARSAAAIGMLSKRGFSNLSNLKGGMDAWRGAKLPVARP